MSKRAGSSSSHRPPKKPKQSGDLRSFFDSPGKPLPHVIIISSDSEGEPAPSKSTSAHTTPKTSTSRVKVEDYESLGSNKPSPVVDQSYPLDKDVFEFDPAVHVDVTTWPRSKDGLQVPYAFMTAAFRLISATKSRLAIVTILTNTLRTIVLYQPTSLLAAVYLITNHVAPAYEGIELGIGSQVLSKSLKDVSGSTAKQLKTFWNQYGDMGDVAFAAKSAVRTLVPAPALTVSGVYSTLLKICGLKGQGVTSQKSSLVTKMLVSARGEEVRFLVRTLVANLRIGAVRLTVTASLARCFCLAGPSPSGFEISKEERNGLKAAARTVKEGKDDPRRKPLMERLASAERLMKKVYVRHPNYNDIIPALLSGGLDGLEDAVPLTVGVPLCNMLGQITRNLDDVASRLQPSTEFVAEWKYDGQRVQIHAHRLQQGQSKSDFDKDLLGKKKGGKFIGTNGDIYARLFSGAIAAVETLADHSQGRHLEDMTDKYPDVLQLVAEMFHDSASEDGLTSFVMDAEIVAIDSVTGDLLNFQTLSNRAKKDVQIGEIKVKAKVFAFDLMHLNGKSLLTETFRSRRSLLHAHFPARDPQDIAIARFGHVNNVVAQNDPEGMDAVASFMVEATSSKCEGLMIKILDHEMVPQVAQIQTKPASDDDIDKEEVKTAMPEQTAKGTPKKGHRKLLLSSYEPDKRADSWMKVKKDYSETGGDSFDLVPIAVWHGQGRKAGWWSPILLAVYDPKNDTYSAVCKCISGFTDQFYKDLNERYPRDSETCSRLPFVECATGLQPDWYLKPNEVWEMRGADITLSPVYPAAKGKIPGSDRGLSMRFPRFMKLREDKGVTQATTPTELAEAYFRQEAGRRNEAQTHLIKEVTAAGPSAGNLSDSEGEEDALEDAWAFDILE